MKVKVVPIKWNNYHFLNNRRHYLLVNYIEGKRAFHEEIMNVHIP